MSTHAFVAVDCVIARCGVVSQHHPAGNHGVVDVAVVVWIVIQDDQPVGELAGDIGIVSATLLGTKVHPVTTRIAGDALDERAFPAIRSGIDDGDRRGQGVSGDHEFPIRADRCLDR